jgi:hypothetical protein
MKYDKMRLVKIIHVLVHRKLLIFFSKPQIFKDLSEMLIKSFQLKKINEKSILPLISDSKQKMLLL